MSDIKQNKKLSWNIERGSHDVMTWSNEYTYKFRHSQYIEKIDDLSDMSSYSYNEIKQKVVDSIVSEFRTALNNVVFVDPAGKEYVEYMEDYKKELMSLSDYSGEKIECDAMLSLHNWDRLFNSFDSEKRNQILDSIKEYKTCKIRKMSGSIQNADRHPDYCWEEKGIAHWFEISFFTNWSERVAVKNNQPFAKGIGVNFFIDPRVWFTVYRIQVQNK